MSKARAFYYLSDDVLELPKKEIVNGIMEFERNAHYVDDRKPVKGIFRRIDFTIRGIRPHAWFSNYKNEIEPVYFLNWKYLKAARGMKKDGSLIFDNEKKYDLDPETLKHMLSLKLASGLTMSSGFKLPKKVLIIAGLVIGGIIFLVFLNQMHVIHLW